jgi:hypothetical protein
MNNGLPLLGGWLELTVLLSILVWIVSHASRKPGRRP